MSSRFNVTEDAKNTFKVVQMASGLKSTGFLTANVIVGDVSDDDIDLLFGPDEDEVVITVPTDFRWPQLLKLLGVFSSAGQARKNGWDKDIEEGWSEALFKKQRKAVFILKVTANV